MERGEEDGKEGERDHPGLLLHGRKFQTPVKIDAEKRWRRKAQRRDMGMQRK